MAWKNYNYMCKNEKCENKEVLVEELVKDSEKDELKCEHCGELMVRLLGVGAIKTNDNFGRMS